MATNGQRTMSTVVIVNLMRVWGDTTDRAYRIRTVGGKVRVYREGLWLATVL